MCLRICQEITLRCTRRAFADCVMGMMVYEAVRRIFNNPRRLIVNMLKHQMGDHLLIIYTEG